jgi:hypothetical protein
MSFFKETEYKVVSVSDMLNHPNYEELNEKGDEGLYRILWDMGIDIHNKKELEYSYCQHRSDVTKQVVHCGRWVGALRKDDEWKRIMYMIRGY